MNLVSIVSKTASENSLQATFLPEMGMNMISLKLGDIEIIDPSSKALFDERFAGLGALIGPHFHRRKTEILPKIADETLFPHIARVKAKGVADPFSHGIARYAPWKVTATPHSISGTLTGKDLWHEVPLATLEGQNFIMHYRAEIQDNQLIIDMDVVSDTDSLVGIHYYYHLPEGKNKVSAQVQEQYLSASGKQPLPESWFNKSQHLLTFDLAQEADFTFYPYPHPSKGEIVLETPLYRLTTSYQCPSQENAWQLYHPQGASYVCIEPLSAQDPHHPNLSVSRLRIALKIDRL